MWMNGGHLAWFMDRGEDDFVTRKVNDLVPDRSVRYWYIGKVITIGVKIMIILPVLRQAPDLSLPVKSDKEWHFLIIVMDGYRSL